MVWYSHLLRNFPQLIMIHTVKGFGIVNKAMFFWNSLAFSMIQQMLAIEDIILSKISPTQREKYSMIPLTRDI